MNVLSNIKKLVHSLLLLNPEAYLSLSPEVQTAWRLIENEPTVREIDAALLKSLLRKEPDTNTSWEWLSAAMPWYPDLRRAAKLAEELEVDKLMHLYVDMLDRCSRRSGGCDVQKFKELLENERVRERNLQSDLAPWNRLFQEHCRARVIVGILCTWCVRHSREYMGEAIYMTSGLLKGLSDVLLQVFNVEADAQEEQTSSHNLSQETLLCGGGGSAEGIVGSDVKPLNDYPLQGYIEAFFFSLVSEKGVEEAEMLRVEALMAELIRMSVLSHHAWLHSLIAKGVFLMSPVGGRQLDAGTRRHQRLLANLPFFPEARHDSCQRRILLRKMGILDMGPCAPYYALKINRYLFWSAADLDVATICHVQAPELIADVLDAPQDVEAIGVFGQQRVLAVEWEESVKMSWLQSDLKSDMLDAGGSGGVGGGDGVQQAARGQAGLSALFATLAAVMSEAPLYVKAQLSRHISAVLKVIVHRDGHKSDLELIDLHAIPEDLKITEELLFRAVVLLEIAADSRSLVMLLKFLLERASSDRHSGYTLIPALLVTHLRTVRALELTLDVWKSGIIALIKAQQAHKLHIVRKIEEMLKVLVTDQRSVDAEAVKMLADQNFTQLSGGGGMKALQEYLRSFDAGVLRSPGLEGLVKLLEEADVSVDAAADDMPALAMTEQSQRPELLQVVEQMLAGGVSMESAADKLLKFSADFGAGEGALVACIVRSTILATVKECRGGGGGGGGGGANSRAPPLGLAIGQCVALLAALEARRNSKDELTKMVLPLIIKGILEPDPLTPALDGTGATPNSVVDTPTPGPQTPFSPATPDSLPVVAKKSERHIADEDAAIVALRQDAWLALVCTMMARGLVCWQFVQGRFAQELKQVPEQHRLLQEKRLVLATLSCVEMLLTEKRHSAAAMMTQMDCLRLNLIRRTQDREEAFNLLLSLVGMCENAPHNLKRIILARMHVIMQDSAMLGITASDDPAAAFLTNKGSGKKCMLLLRIYLGDDKNLNPFRSFSFRVSTERNGDILMRVQNLISRVNNYSMKYDCVELRLLSDAWRGALDEFEGYVEDGWEAWRAANGSMLRLFEEEMERHARRRAQQGDKDAETQLAVLKRALRRDRELWFEHHIVEMLLAEFWRAPHKAVHLVQFAKAVGHYFQNDLFPSGWFETQLLQVVFALLGCEPIKCGIVCLDVCFREFIDRSVPNANASAGAEAAGHVAAFEASLVHLLQRCGVPYRAPIQEPSLVDKEKIYQNAALRSRRLYSLQILGHLQTLVEKVQGGDFVNESMVEHDEKEQPFSKPQTLGSMQKACILHLQLLNAAVMQLPDRWRRMEQPDDDGKLTSTMLNSSIATIKRVCACPHLTGDVLGDTLYRCALASMDNIAALMQAIDGLSRESKLCLKYAWDFKSELREGLLRGHVPSFVNEHLCTELPADKSRPINAKRTCMDPKEEEEAGGGAATGSATAATGGGGGGGGGHSSANQALLPAEHAEPPQGSRDGNDDMCPWVDNDPWLLLEHNPRGVLRHRLVDAKRRRKRLTWEVERSELPAGGGAPQILATVYNSNQHSLPQRSAHTVGGAGGGHHTNIPFPTLQQHAASAAMRAAGGIGMAGQDTQHAQQAGQGTQHTQQSTGLPSGGFRPQPSG